MTEQNNVIVLEETDRGYDYDIIIIPRRTVEKLMEENKRLRGEIFELKRRLEDIGFLARGAMSDHLLRLAKGLLKEQTNSRKKKLSQK